jgi:exopolysaccharide biosynthesis WecB/TagA/CpsF family protein
MIDRGKHNILGVRIDAVDYEAAVEQIVRAAHACCPMAVSALAVHGLMTGVLDESHRYRLNRFDLLVPDGQPVRWALNLLHGVRLGERVYGPNLMLKVCRRAADERLPVLLYGGTSDLLRELSVRLRHRFPQLDIAGAMPSLFRRMTPAERDRTVDAIRATGAAITLVGLGCPRQEVWAYEFRRALSMPLIAVGAAFAFHAGRLPQAPEYLQHRGLEWFYRLAHEPNRLWRRYLLLNPLYVGLLSLQLAGLHRFDAQCCLPPAEELLYG